MLTLARVRRTAEFLVSAGVLSLLAACLGDPVMPRTVNGGRTQADASRVPPWLRANAVKYRDVGSHPATGRAGHATLTSRALLAKDGTALVEATTGQLDANAAPPGQIAKVQTKITSYADTGTANYTGLDGGGYWSHAYDGLSRSDRVQLQADIRGIDASRTDVVTVLDTVRLLPDLQVSGLVAPERAFVNSAVQISATIREINRDVGAHTDCVLLVDGTQVEAASGIWVDAGDAVTCAFVTKFADVGTKQLTISAVDVQPADWDTTNNSVTGSIDVVSPEILLHWSSSVWGQDQTFDQQYSDPWYAYALTGFERYRSVSTTGSVSDTTTAGDNLTMTATLISDGNTIGTASAPLTVTMWWSANCHSGYDPASNTSFAFCHDPSAGVTSMSAQNYSTRAVYYGYDYYAYNGYTYVVNVDGTSGFGGYAVGSTVGFDVKATDASNNVWHAAASVPITTTGYVYACTSAGNYTCSGYTDGAYYNGRASGN